MSLMRGQYTRPPVLCWNSTFY